MAVTMRVMARTMMVFRRNMTGWRDEFLTGKTGETSAAGDFLLARSRLRCGAAIFLQLVVQSFQADAKNLSGPGFIVACSFKSFEDQHLLGLFDGSADTQPDCVG